MNILPPGRTCLFVLFAILIFAALIPAESLEAAVGPPAGNENMVIIAPSSFARAIRPLIAHKNRFGIPTGHMPVELIYTCYPGRDDAEKVKRFIKDAVEYLGVRYVLLMGGRKGQNLEWHVPVRYVLLDDGFKHKEHLSDLYFADLYKQGGQFEDWDSNKDNVFAEWGKDTLDLVRRYGDETHLPKLEAMVRDEETPLALHRMAQRAIREIGKRR